MNHSTAPQTTPKNRPAASARNLNLVTNGSATQLMGMTHSMTPVFSSTAGLGSNRNRLLINAG